MIDLSIRNINSIKSDKKIKEFFQRKVIITEKFDGTKLTLTRNNEAFDPSDYNKNWIISYKGHIIYKEELKTKYKVADIRESSISVLQYKIVHNHLARIHKNLKDIEVGTEFFIEFIQRKPTLTRKYKKYHDMFLIRVANVIFEVNDDFYNSNQVGYGWDVEDRREYLYFCNQLNLKPLPILHEGQIHYNEKNIRKSLTSFTELFLDFESTCGGKPEGVVISSIGSKDVWKIVQEDQFNKELRNSIKNEWKDDEIKESQYWKLIENVSMEIFNKLDLLESLPNIIKQIREESEKTSISFTHSKKNILNIHEDIYLTTKRVYQLRKEVGFNNKKLGLIAMAAKPLHEGHWRVIKRALEDCDVVNLFLSIKSRKKNNEYEFKQEYAIDLMRLYNMFFPDKINIIASENPLTDLKIFVNRFKGCPKFLTNINIYFGEKEDIDSYFEDLILNENLQTIKIPIDINISGTEMRQFILENKKQEFISFLPEIFSIDIKEEIWKILNKSTK